MKKTRTLKRVYVFFLMLFFGFVSPALASESPSLVDCLGANCGFCDFLKIIQNLFFWLLSISFAVALFFSVLSGATYLFSFGSEKNKKMAKRGLKYALLGFSLCLLSFFVIYVFYKILGYQNSGRWWQIECQTSLGEAEAEKEEELSKQRIQYKNEVLLSELGGRENPISLKDLPTMVAKDLERNKYFFIHGLAGQPLDDSVKQIVQILKEVSQKNENVYTVLPNSIGESGEVVDTKLVNLNNYFDSGEKNINKEIKKLLTEVISKAPSTEVPFYVSQKNVYPSKFSNDWPEISGKIITTLTKGGVLYSENIPTAKNAGLDFDASDVTFNFKYDSKSNSYFLNKDNPVTFNFTDNVPQKAMEEATVAISETISSSLLNKNFKEESLGQLTSLIVKNLKNSSTQKILNNDNSYSPGLLPAGVVKAPNLSELKDTLSINQQMAQLAKEIIEKESTEGGLKSNSETQSDRSDVLSEIESTVAKAFQIDGFSAPSLPAPPTTGDSWMPPFPTAPTPETTKDSSPTPSLDRGSTNVPSGGSEVRNEGEKRGQEVVYPGGNTIAERVSAVSNYDISELKYRVSTDRILDLEEREKLRGMIEGLNKEIAENGTDMKIPTDFVMCFFQKESKFDAGAISSSGCSGIGQMCMADSKDALKQLEKYAPKHFEELSKKVAKDGKGDLKKIIMSDDNKKKRELLRSDPNLSVALSVGLLDSKKRGGPNGKGKPIGNDRDLEALANRYGPGDEPGYGREVLNCYQNNGWKKILSW